MWKINRSYIGGKTKSKTFQSDNYNKDNKSEKFLSIRLLDDDKNVMFGGKSSDLYEGGDLPFEPLDYLQSLYGCTELQYKEDNKWKTL